MIWPLSPLLSRSLPYFVASASVIAVSIHNEERANRTRRFLGLGRRLDRDPETKRSSIRGKRRFSAKGGAKETGDESEAAIAQEDEVVPEVAKGKEPEGTRRNVYVNLVRLPYIHEALASAQALILRRPYSNQQPLPVNELYNDDPVVRYSRNKVRTSKYTILTFLPKNIIFEQFRRCVLSSLLIACSAQQAVHLLTAFLCSSPGSPTCTSSSWLSCKVSALLDSVTQVETCP